MDFSCNIYPFKDLAKTDYQNVCRVLSEIGYKAIEPIHGLIPESADVLRDVPGDLGMSLVSGFVAITSILSGESEALLSFYRNAGIDKLAIGMLPNPDDEAYGSTEAAVKAIAEAEKVASNAGFELLLHNHGRSLLREPDGRLLLEHFLDVAGVMLELDVGFVHAAGLDMADTLDKLGKRVRLIHLKDVTASQASVDFGQGDVDFHLVLSWCAANNIPYPMVEHHLAEPPEKSLAACFEYVDGVAREIGL